MTKFGVHGSTLPELFADAAFPALDDAGVTQNELDAFYFGNAMSGLAENETHLAPKVATHMGMTDVPFQRFEDACATSANAFKNAVQAVEAGIHDTVLVGGVERCTPKTGMETPEMTRVFASASHRQYEQPSGLTFPGVFALLTKRHMHEYGTTENNSRRSLSRTTTTEVSTSAHISGRRRPSRTFSTDLSWRTRSGSWTAVPSPTARPPWS